VTPPAPEQSAPTAARLTDPRAIGAPLLAALVAIVTLDAVLELGVFGSGPRGDVPLITRFLTGVVEGGVLWVVLLLGRITWLHPRWSRRHPALTIVTIMVGAQVGSRTATRTLVGRGLREPELGIGIDPTVFLTATTVVLLVLMSVLAEHRAATGALRDGTRRLRGALDEGEQALRDERESLRLQVRDLLEARLGTTSQRSSTLTADGLRELAERVLRPLSHQLADMRTGFEPSEGPATARLLRRVPRTLRDLRPTPIIQPRLLAATMLLLTFRSSVRPPDAEQVVRDGATLDPTAPPGTGLGVQVEVDWASFVPSVLLHVITFVVMLYGARVLVRHLERRSTSTLASHWALALGTLTVLGVLLFGLLRLVHLLPGFSRLGPVSIGAVLGYVAPILLVTVAVSLIAGTEAALRRAREEMARTNEELTRAVARINALLTHERRTFARHLHASVQAAVNAGSLLLRRALDHHDDGSDDVPADVVARVGQLLERSLLDLDRRDADDRGFPARLDAVAATWRELCDVSMDVGDDVLVRLATDPVASATLGDLVAEACANAVVHGNATTLQVTLRLTGDQAHARVRDDGTAVHPMRRDGLGTRTLEAHCTSWSLEIDEGGTTLEATLPIR
jgi:signal transduction histidine kinase